MIDESAQGIQDVKMDVNVDARLLRAFCCGTLTGLTVGMLFAPGRGTDTRRRLISMAQNASSRAAARLRRTRPSQAEVAPFHKHAAVE